MTTILKALNRKAGDFARGLASAGIAVLVRQSAIYILSIAVVVSVSVLLLNLALSLSGLTRTENFTGPFAAEAPGSSALVVYLSNDSKLSRLLSTGGDSPSNPFRSSLSIRINGAPLGPPHTLHDKIRNDETAGGAYSHWGNNIIFSLPATLTNSSDVELHVEYPVSLGNRLLDASNMLLAASLLLLGLRKSILDSDGFARLTTAWHNLFFMASRAAWLLLFGAAAVFLATTVYGFFDGYYLPNVAVFSYFPWVKQLAWLEPSAPYVILVYAIAGILLVWMALLTNRNSQEVCYQEQRLVAMFNRYGLVFVSAAFLFSIAGTWAGIPRPQDLSASAVGGLIPFNDATGHFVQTFFQASNGHWDYLASRRPFASALRSSGMFLTGYSNALFLGIQTVLIALATFYATRSIMRWRGLWAGLTFLGLTMIQVRPYLPTNLTEPLGILLALVSIPYFVRAISDGTTAAKGASFLLICWALIARMGNMFLIPALGVWIFLSSEKTHRAKRNAVLLVSACVIFVIAFNTALSKLYGSDQGTVGGNFGSVFCGLAHNGNWTRCGELYAEALNPLAGDEASQAKLYYRLGLEKLVAEPSLFVSRVGSGAWQFLLNFQSVLLKSYTGGIPDFFPASLWLVVSFFGMWLLLKKGISNEEGSFWGLFVLSLVASASIVYFDEGPRVLCVSYPLLSLLFASGFSVAEPRRELMPTTNAAQTRMYFSGFSLIIVVSLACLSLPWTAYRLDLTQTQMLQKITKKPGEEIYLASRYMSGFLVVPDENDLPKGAPAMSLKNFTEIIINSNIEQYEKLEIPPASAGPFAVVAAPGLVSNGGKLLIAPPKMLLDRAALGWKVTFSGGKTWMHVAGADPIYRTGGEQGN